VQEETGKVRVKTDLTPARRYSFLVGRNEPNHTAQQQLLPLLKDDSNNPTLSELENAFSVEAVTKEFFLKYRDLFIRTKEALDRVINNDAKIKADFETKGVNTVDFAKKLLGQIVFLYFLQKKGWFGVSRGKDWGEGDRQFLRHLLVKAQREKKNYFNRFLEPLFYEALRLERPKDYYDQFECRIPFLNGGLFDPINEYDWQDTDIEIPNEVFSNTRRTKEGDTGDGILDVFDRYNFTVKEDEPLEKEVAIDPELLGKAYEKFNAIRPDNFEEYKKALKSGKKGDENKFNKQFGVYYTPREIVHYMCRQSLINYLFNELNSGATSYEKLGDSNLDMLGNEAKKGQLDIMIEHKNPEISKEDIETLIHLGEQVSENEGIALIKEQKIREGRQKTTEYEMKLPSSIRKNAKLIDDKLANITVCDPAVGSGAFPVGMMSEIVKARKVLFIYHNNPYNSGHNSGLKPAVICSIDSEYNTYNLKRRCIEHSLYGLDIDPGAVEIAKLRLWLSLMVDEDDIQQGASAPCHIKPLPNLDYKIVCGNSLLGVEKNLFNYQLFAELESLKSLYFNETNPTKKQNYKKQIDDLISQLTNGHTEFDFEVYFSEVFHEKTIEKNWKAYHITWVTHGCRISERMVELGVRTGDPVVLDEASRLVIADALAEKIREKQYRVLAVNVLTDHVHCVVVCEEDDAADIVQQLKGYSSHQHNRQLQLSVQGEGRQTKLWAKGSSQTLLESEEHLLNAIEYVENNHLKHYMSEVASSAHHRQLKQSVVGVDQAFAPITHPAGFDVVIANPPYLVLSADFPDLDYFESHFYVSHGGKKNLYKLFFERGLTFLKKGGALSFISPNNYLTSADSVYLRDLLVKQTHIHEIIEYSETDKVFDSVTQAVCTIVLTKSENKNPFISYIKNSVQFRIDQNTIMSHPKRFIKHTSPVIKRIELQVYKLDDFVIGFQGEVNVSTKKALFTTKPTSSKQRPLVRGNQIKRYCTVHFPAEYCAIGVQSRDHYEKERVVFQEVCNAGAERRVSGTLMRDMLCGHTTNYLISKSPRVDNKFLLALINSSLINHYFKFYNQTNHVPIGEIKQIPVPDLSTAKQDVFISLVERILAAKKRDPKADTTAWERKIDRLVYELYGLTEDEIAIVEGKSS
jgi:REP element-mobilizing transposase RayT